MKNPSTDGFDPASLKLLYHLGVKKVLPADTCRRNPAATFLATPQVDFPSQQCRSPSGKRPGLFCNYRVLVSFFFFFLKNSLRTWRPHLGPMVRRRSVSFLELTNRMGTPRHTLKVGASCKRQGCDALWGSDAPCATYTKK